MKQLIKKIADLPVNFWFAIQSVVSLDISYWSYFLCGTNDIVHKCLLSSILKKGRKVFQTPIFIAFVFCIMLPTGSMEKLFRLLSDDPVVLDVHLFMYYLVLLMYFLITFVHTVYLSLVSLVVCFKVDSMIYHTELF